MTIRMTPSLPSQPPRVAPTGSRTKDGITINLKQGWPSLDLLPVTLIKQAIDKVFTDSDAVYDGLCYGPDPGYQPLRKAIAKWLTDFYRSPPSISNPPNPAPSYDFHSAGSEITAERICITGGASQSNASLLNIFTDPSYTRNIWIVAPSYMLAYKIFSDAGFAHKMRGIPEDEDGLDIAHLRREIQKSEEDAIRKGLEEPKLKGRAEGIVNVAKIYKHVIYCVPTFANPSSRTMSLTRRIELVRLAREFDALIIPDDVYDFLQWPTNPAPSSTTGQALTKAHLPRLVDIDRDLDGGAERKGADGFGNVCSNGSFSKLAGPGMRVGWVEGTEAFAYAVSQSGQQKSGGAPSQLTSTYFAEMLNTGGLQKHIFEVLQPKYATRYQLLMSAIEKEVIPLGCTLPQADREVVGGYFVWLGLPKGVDAARLEIRAQKEQKLIVAAGVPFAVPEKDMTALRYDDHIRLCFAWEDEQNLTAGIERLAATLRNELAEV